MRICIFGASSDTLAKEYYDAARELGLLIAAGGHGIVYGGASDGLMGACAFGVLDGGGEIVGVAPRFFDEGGILLKDRGRFIFTDTMAERKSAMEELSDGFIVLPGGIGTLEEMFEVLTLKMLGQHAKPIVLLNTLGCYDPLIQFIDRSIEQGFVSPMCSEALLVRSTPQEALSALLSAERVLRGGIRNYTKQAST